MNFILTFLVCLFPICIFAQGDSIAIHFTMKFQNEKIELEKQYYSEKHQDSIQINKLKFYISDFYLFQDSIEIYQFPKKHFLIDLEDEQSQNLQIDSNFTGINFNKIKFNLGVDSLTNVSGAYGGDLDPTNGMYWTWNSGYINFKLEGVSKVCPSRKNVFQYHLGGFMEPYNSIQTVELTSSTVNSLEINVDIEVLLNAIDLSKTYEVMSPSKKSIILSKKAVEIFHVK